MKKKMIPCIGFVLVISIAFGKSAVVSYADAEHLNQNDTYNHTVPAAISLNSHGVIDFREDDNKIILDSRDITSLQNELQALYTEIDAYTGSNMAGN